MAGRVRHVALLRGVNVGGKNRVSMTDLVALFERAGATDVDTYIQSGNVVFGAAPAVLRRLPQAVEKALGVPIVLRTAAAMARTVKGNPFLTRGADPTTLHVAFLAARPRVADVRKLDQNRSPPDEFEVLSDVVYVRAPKGLARSKLTTAYLDGTLRTTATFRNWRTVVTLRDMLTRKGT